MPTVDPKEINVAAPFSELFAISQKTLDDITESIRKNGFDESRPLNVWREGCVLVDGHTRRQAAIKAGIRDVPVHFHDFADEDEAVLYAIHSQIQRRQLTPAEIVRMVPEIDRREKPKFRGNKHTSGSTERSRELSLDSTPDRNIRKRLTAEETAEKLGTSASMIKAARVVLDHKEEFPDVIDAVLKGELRPRKAEQVIRERKSSKKEANKKKPKRKWCPGYTPVVVEPTLNPQQFPDADCVVLTEEEQQWLKSHSLRNRVVTRRFDQDAIIYRRLSTVTGNIKAEVQSSIGRCALDHSGILYRFFCTSFPLPPIEAWAVCEKCNGSGCGRCKSCGYLIPNF